MSFLRSHPRLTDTRDLSARLRSRGRRPAARRVLNLSEGGMLVGGSELEVGEIAQIELVGPDFRSEGVAEVAHRTGDVTGLRFVRWDVSASRKVHKLVRTRISGQRSLPDARSIPGEFLG